MMQSVILAGGLGTRLMPYTLFIPKPMLPLGEKPLLEHLLEWNKRHGIDEVIICTSYLGRIIEDYFEGGERFEIPVRYASSRRPLATAGQLRTAHDMIKDTFVCMYGDSIYDFDLSRMIQRHKTGGAFITMGLYNYRSTIPYGVIDTDASGNVTAWNEKPQSISQVNMGCYVMEPEVFSYMPPNRPWGMDQVIQSAIKDGRTVLGHLTQGGFTDVGTISAYNTINQKYRERLGRI